MTNESFTRSPTSDRQSCDVDALVAGRATALPLPAGRPGLPDFRPGTRGSRRDATPSMTRAACTLFHALLALGLPAAALADNDNGSSRHCTNTASLAFHACENGVSDDHFRALAICTNESDEHDRDECLDEAEDARREANRDCREQRGARRDLCRAVGEGRYDPDFDEQDFDDDFTDLTNPNPYFPLDIGNIAYFEGDESIVIEVKAATKLIDDVTCVVVNDSVHEDGLLVEDTDDWFAQARNGDVWYCGEQSKDYEYFEGDAPPVAELVSIDGSFKADRDGDKPGIQFRRMPRVGEVYRQEFSLGNAEDAARVLSVSYKYGVDADLDLHVPAALASLLCGAGDCVVVQEFSPLSPDSNDRKFYAPGIGLFLDLSVDSGDKAQLVDCNYDDRCDDLPEP
jgi:hypothetical protein